MKVILSRKGFDSKYGGCPSPIFPDDSMVSLPIPSSSASLSYSGINYNGKNLGSIVESLTAKRIAGDSITHFDPDLDRGAIARDPGWLAAFGAGKGARTHLKNNNVKEGDLFLFFGWFRRVEFGEKDTTRYLENSPNIHAIFGWLQIGEILHVGSSGKNTLASKPWLKDHPHITGSWYPNNTIFIASEKLEMPDCSLDGDWSGGGAFGSFSQSRVLTHPHQGKRSLWCLPENFAPQNGIAALSCHHNPERWKKSPIPGCTQLQTVSQGQEFVLEVKDKDILCEWLKGIFEP